MIRVITYLLIYFFGVAITFAQITSEEITLNNQVIQLPGTLSYPTEKIPLIIWVHGSGSVNRNGNTPNYIKQFRDAVNKENIAFFSYDKRTANPKNAAFLKDIQINDFINDLEEVVSYFKNDKRFTKIILAGHSQGSLIAMMVLENIDKYISIAGAGETIDKTLIRQLTAQNLEFGKVATSHFKELKETGEIKKVNPNLITIFAKQNQPFWLSWVKLNPVEEIKKVTIPMLIINGDKDLQVLISDAKNLKKAKPNTQFVIIKNMNHVLKNIEKNEDNLKSYYSPNYPISEKLIENVVTFVKK